MQITIMTFGSRGDVQPLVALGRGLQAAGHQVRLATYRQYETFISEYGLDFCPITGDMHAILMGESGRIMLDKGRNPLYLARGMAQAVRPELEKIAADCWQACQGADALLLGGASYYAGAAIAEKLEIPFVTAFLQPLATPTTAFASAIVPPLPVQSGRLNRLTFTLSAQLFWQLLRPIINQARTEQLQLPAWPWRGPFRRHTREHRPVLYGYSPSVVPRPADWPENVHVTGYWFLDRLEKWQPPAGLCAFLEAGPPPVYVGFGSMNNRDPRETAELVLNALAMAGQRGVLLSGWGGLHKEELPDTVYMVDNVPHDWMFQQVAAVVHHGGSGTTAAGLRAGAPTVIIPFFGDQPFWGKQVQALGVGPEAIPRKRLTAEGLGQAIDAAVNKPEIRQRAMKLAQHIQAEDGIGMAVELFNRLTARNRPPTAAAELFPLFGGQPSAVSGHA